VREEECGESGCDSHRAESGKIGSWGQDSRWRVHKWSGVTGEGCSLLGECEPSRLSSDVSDDDGDSVRLSWFTGQRTSEGSFEGRCLQCKEYQKP
jgi:hypothetical protein